MGAARMGCGARGLHPVRLKSVCPGAAGRQAEVKALELRRRQDAEAHGCAASLVPMEPAAEPALAGSAGPGGRLREEKGGCAAGVLARRGAEATRPAGGRQLQGRLLRSALGRTARRLIGTDRRNCADSETRGNHRRQHSGRFPRMRKPAGHSQGSGGREPAWHGMKPWGIVGHNVRVWGAPQAPECSSGGRRGLMTGAGGPDGVLLTRALGGWQCPARAAGGGPQPRPLPLGPRSPAGTAGRQRPLPG